MPRFTAAYGNWREAMQIYAPKAKAPKRNAGQLALFNGAAQTG